MEQKGVQLSLLEKFDSIIVLDTETTGINHKSDEIIELAMYIVSRGEEGRRIEEYDRFIRLSPGRQLPPEITRLTGISEDMIEREGVSKEEAGRAFAAALSRGRPLVAAYNAQFDLCFLYYFLSRLSLADSLKNACFLDAMTVYRDRQAYPHKLAAAIEKYSVDAVNSHRAIDDTRAAYLLLCAMAQEKDDLLSYVNLFGYSSRYGISGPRISSIRYLPQGFRPGDKPLYQQ